MQVSQEVMDSEDIRNNDFYNQTITQLIEDYTNVALTADVKDHLAMVEPVMAIRALRILHAKLVEPSEIHEIKGDT